jgi:hypothetical protein
VVRLIETRRDGRTVWVEDGPADCSRGHGRIGATWAQCPKETCRAMCRQWRCMNDGCGERFVDPDHAHRYEPPPGVHVGG